MGKDKGDTMTREQMSEAIRRTAVNDRLSCEKAHALSRELNISLNEIGALCNEMKIKIADCQLGCF